MDRILNSLKDTSSIVYSKNLDGNECKNREIISRLEKDGYIIIRAKYETNNYVVFSITDNGIFFKYSGGYTALEKKERRKKIKDFFLNMIKFVAGFFSIKLFFLLFHTITL